MARDGIDGLEIPDTTFISGSGVSFSTTTVRSGLRSIRALAQSGVVGSYTVQGGAAGTYCRIYVRVVSRPASTARVFLGGGAYEFRLNPNGTLALYTGPSPTGVLVGTSTTALTDTTKWYLLEYRRSFASITGVLLRIDGVDEITGTQTSPIGTTVGPYDTVADTYEAFYDDYVDDDAEFPGPGKIVMLLPVSDSNRGAWTGGVGGTTNLFDAVNNLPPLGTAAETDLTQIESAANSATDNCDLNMQTYASAGLVAGDTIQSVRAVAIHGEDISTGTKAGALTIVSNPAQAGETALTFGGDNGAVGTWPHFTWMTLLGDVVSVPTVTLGTSPVLRIGKRTATSRVVSCCFMGIYVDYTPAVDPMPVLPKMPFNPLILQ